MKVLLLFSLLMLPSTVIAIPPKLSQEKHNALFTEAESMGYVMEYGGRVFEKSETCDLVRFDFADWLSDSVFKQAADLIFNESKVVHPDSARVIFDRYAPKYVADAKAAFTSLTAHLAEFIPHPSQVMHNITINSTFPYMGIALDHAPKERDWIYAVYQIVKTESANKGVEAMGMELLTDLQAAYFALSTPLTSTNWIALGGATFYGEVAKRILDADYDFSIVRPFGLPTAALSRISIKGRSADSAIIAEVCIPNVELTEGYDAYHIRPTGVLEDGKIYTFPQLPTLYAADGKMPTMENLLVLDGVLFRGFAGEGDIIIVEKLQRQDKHCSLMSPVNCHQRRMSLASNKGTIVFPLDDLSLVVTNEKFAECVDAKENNRWGYTITHHTFLIDGGKCLLKIGSKYAGRTTDTTKIDINHSPFMYLNDLTDPISWYNSQENRDLGIKIGLTVALALFLISTTIYTIYSLCKIKKDHSTIEEMLGQ